MQPHCSQSGLPPNWHGVMRRCRSDDTHSVVFANVHSSGLDGGLRYTSTIPFGMRSFGYRERRSRMVSTTRLRSSGRSRSSDSSPICGV